MKLKIINNNIGFTFIESLISIVLLTILGSFSIGIFLIISQNKRIERKIVCIQNAYSLIEEESISIKDNHHLISDTLIVNQIALIDTSGRDVIQASSKFKKDQLSKTTFYYVKRKK